jgi:hypothetical protein
MSHLNSSGHSLLFSAGPAARRDIEANGFRPDRIGTLAGASGGAKWLALSQLDRVVASRVLPQLNGPVHTIATSIGAWRFACYAQADPLAAIDRFEEAYLSQAFSKKPDRAEITAVTSDILDYVLGDSGVKEILSHPVLRMHVMAVRTRGALATEHRAALAAALLAVASANIASRRVLGLFCDRVLFHDPRDTSPFHSLQGFPMFHVPMNAGNLKDSILATGSIPLVLAGVRDIDGAPKGMYRDGGVIDYHLDFPHSQDDKLSLYLHFYDRLKPGWFDKRLSWRNASAASTDRTLLISPSPEFVTRLPNGKIPDRTDFTTMAPAERERAWRTTVSACRELADELEDVLDKNRLAERLRPIGN